MLLSVLAISPLAQAQRVVRYELHVRDTTVNYTGKNKRAIAVNGQIPMPTLTFTEGDTAEIMVYNEMNEETSLHWHGLFLPNKYDGVPYLTQMPIKAHSKHMYRFAIIQNGTHWYHSHHMLQEQIGMYGSMILNKRNDDPTYRKGIDDLPTIPLILSEWTNMKPEQIYRRLRNASDWFSIQKGSTQSYAEAVREGYLKTKLKNEYKRMAAMDVSDIYYDYLLVNGKKELLEPRYKVGDKVRLRISNGGGSTYFWLNYAGGKITVVASDGNDVVPVVVDRLLIAVSETYDVIVTIPTDSTAFQFLVTSEDRTKNTSLWLGSGIKQLANQQPGLNYFKGMKMMNGMMKMNGKLDDMGMHMSLNKMDMNVVMYPEITGDDIKKINSNQEDRYASNKLSEIVTLNYGMLKSTKNTTLPKGPLKELRFELTGNMNRYIWSIDNKVLSETDRILIKKGENIRIIIYNGSMMRHPMHLHGHDFRLINGQGMHAPLKNVVDIMPMETDTLLFNANAEGDWFFHCHILYHMMGGMGRVFTYENQAKNPEIPNPKLAKRKLLADDKKIYVMAENDFATNGNDGQIMLQNTRWSLGTEWRLGYSGVSGYETETHLGRYIGRMQWLMPFIGFDRRRRNIAKRNEESTLFNQKNTKDNRSLLSLGVNYTLPMLFHIEGEIFTNKNFRLQLYRNDIPVSKRLRASIMANTDKEYMAGFTYIMTRYFSLSTHYDSDMGFGVGVKARY